MYSSTLGAKHKETAAIAETLEVISGYDEIDLPANFSKYEPYMEQLTKQLTNSYDPIPSSPPVFDSF